MNVFIFNHLIAMIPPLHLLALYTRRKSFSQCAPSIKLTLHCVSLSTGCVVSNFACQSAPLSSLLSPSECIFFPAPDCDVKTHHLLDSVVRAVSSQAAAHHLWHKSACQFANSLNLSLNEQFFIQIYKKNSLASQSDRGVKGKQFSFTQDGQSYVRDDSTVEMDCMATVTLFSLSSTLFRPCFVLCDQNMFNEGDEIYFLAPFT